MHDLRRQAAIAAAPPGLHACHTSVIWWKLGAKHDPHVHISIQPVRLFLQLLANNIPGRLRPCIAAQWARLSPLFSSGVRTWRQVSGPLQATLATLLGLGFAAPPHQ